jgi:hypothetical protein
MYYSLIIMLVENFSSIVVKGEGRTGVVYFSTKADLYVQYLSNHYHIIYEVWQYVNNRGCWILTKPVNTLALK